jgi:hypothetical protein
LVADFFYFPGRWRKHAIIDKIIQAHVALDDGYILLPGTGLRFCHLQVRSLLLLSSFSRVAAKTVINSYAVAAICGTAIG